MHTISIKRKGDEEKEVRFYLTSDNKHKKQASTLSSMRYQYNYSQDLESTDQKEASNVKDKTLNSKCSSPTITCKGAPHQLSNADMLIMPNVSNSGSINMQKSIAGFSGKYLLEDITVVS
jgi:hypothetical protein